MLANGLFLSKLAYGMPVWGGCDDYLVRSLQIVQNKAARLVCRKGIYTSIKLYNHTGNCNIDWVENGRNESVPIADTEKQQ